MKWFLILMGTFWVVVGTLTIFTTNMIRKKFFNKFRDIDFKKWSIAPIVIGILFLLSAPESRARIFITLLGVLAFIKGLFLLLGPKQKIKKIVNASLDMEDSLYKVWGVVILALGVLVLINW